MSDLQISLLVLGAVVVAGVLIYNQLQQKTLQKKLTESFGESRRDVLMGEGGTGSDAEPLVRVEPQLDAAPAANPAVESSSAGSADIDDSIDCVASLSSDTPFTAAQVSEVLAGVAACGRTWRAAGYNSASHRWEEVTRAVTGQYSRLRLALQLANRGGPLSAVQLAQFSDVLNTLATRFSGSLDLPDTVKVEADARALDEFCMDVDVAIGVNVVAIEEEGFSGARVRALVESEGFQLEPDGIFHLADVHGNTLLTIANQDAAAPFLPESVSGIHTKGITLLLEVPRVADADGVLQRMFELGRSLSVTMKGRLVDDNRALLTVASMEKIRQQLTDIHARMNARGIAPGSARALRLFS